VCQDCAKKSGLSLSNELARTALATARTVRPRAFARAHLNFHSILPAIGKAGVLVYKPLEAIAAVQ
jgi:hypothetical protein